jgi:hypothetical protein
MHVFHAAGAIEENRTGQADFGPQPVAIQAGRHSDWLYLYNA